MVCSFCGKYFTHPIRDHNETSMWLLRGQTPTHTVEGNAVPFFCSFPKPHRPLALREAGADALARPAQALDIGADFPDRVTTLHTVPLLPNQCLGGDRLPQTTGVNISAQPARPRSNPGLPQRGGRGDGKADNPDIDAQHPRSPRGSHR